jgi:hypothetical protein
VASENGVVSPLPPILSSSPSPDAARFMQVTTQFMPDLERRWDEEAQRPLIDATQGISATFDHMGQAARSAAEHLQSINNPTEPQQAALISLFATFQPDPQGNLATIICPAEGGIIPKITRVQRPNQTVFTRQAYDAAGVQVGHAEIHLQTPVDAPATILAVFPQNQQQVPIPRLLSIITKEMNAAIHTFNTHYQKIGVSFR